MRILGNTGPDGKVTATNFMWNSQSFLSHYLHDLQVSTKTITGYRLGYDIDGETRTKCNANNEMS